MTYTILLNTNIGTIALVCMAMVFLILFFLLIIYLALPKMLDIYFKRKLQREGKATDNYDTTKIPVEGNVNAAIALALAMYMNDLHDKESNIITIEEVKKDYLPWRSKIYGVMNDPRR